MFDDFTAPLDQRWTQTCTGGGSLEIVNSALRMSFASAQQGTYTDAQIDDYGRLARSAFTWKPLLRMEPRSISSGPAATVTTPPESPDYSLATAGSSLWNCPISLRPDI